jgi:predicted dehydrogenase
MRFALLGDHPDGLAMAVALVDSGRHQLLICTTPLAETELSRLGKPRVVADVEEVLADPAIEAVIVAGPPSVRPAQLRRALQSERHVLCVHPADEKPDVAYEAAMLQRDTGYVLLPLLPEGLHPAFARLARFIDRPAPEQTASSVVGAFRLLQFERAATDEVLDNAPDPALEPAIPGWDVLRRLGGELSEVSSFADGEDLAAGLPVLLAGRFEQGGLFQVTLLPAQPAAWWRLVATGTKGQAELTFPQGWNGPAILGWRDETGTSREEYDERFDPWPVLVEAFEAVLLERQGDKETRRQGDKESIRESSPVSLSPPLLVSLSSAPGLSWQDEVRALELDDAARRSVERRRVNLMDYQEASEEVGFKGTMTLVGCAMLWAVLLLLIASRWQPWVGWLILPLLVVFIGMQLLRYVIPSGEARQGDKETRRQGDKET